ncbi:MAG: hypothetical protein GX564_13690 [Oligosphaeraceae bacterium]|nr:hypothetical protein [Oligosphaeraceae bacterium]
MKKTQKNGKVLFDGRLNEAIRRRIREKRLQLGLPYQKLALFFNICWSTLRKWEQGPTMYCSLVMRPKLEAFINGECDEEILRHQKNEVNSYQQKLPASVHFCMDRFTSIYALLECHPELRDELLRGMEQVSQQILENLLNEGRRDRNVEDRHAQFL